MPRIRLNPSVSTSGPPNIIASVKPQNAVPFTQPTCSFVRLNWAIQSPVAPPRSAKLMAVVIRATQLAVNKREEFISGGIGVMTLAPNRRAQVQKRAQLSPFFCGQG